MRIKLTTWLAVLLGLACLPLARAQEAPPPAPAAASAPAGVPGGGP